MNNKIKVNVIDTKTGKTILEGVSMKQVSIYFDIGYSGVQNAVKRKSKIKNRYLVIQTGVFIYTDKINNNCPDDFEERWNETRFLINPNARR